jgi:hypothetical protein
MIWGALSHVLIGKHYINIFTQYQFNGGIARKVFYFLPGYEHAFHIQFSWLNRRKILNPYNKIKTNFIYHWCTQKSVYSNVHSMTRNCVHRTSKPLAFISRVRTRTPKVSPEQGKFWLCTSEDVAQWSPCCVPWTLMKIGGKLPGPSDGQCLLCSLCNWPLFSDKW